MEWPLWAALLAKPAVLLAGAHTVCYLYRRGSASHRHRTLLASLALLLLLPFLPGLPRARAPRPQARAAATVGTAVHSVAAEPDSSWWAPIWALGALAALLPLAAGHMALRRKVRRAAPLHDARWDRAVAEAADGKVRVPELLIAPDATGPLLFGILRPRILLPHDCREWSEMRRRAVALHEVAHIARGDLASQLFAHVAAALWWFHPLVWWTRRCVRLESEQACDEHAVASGMRASDYAAELLALARAPAWNGAAANMARPLVERRLVALLGARPIQHSRARAAVGAAALIGLTITASAVPGGEAMKRTLLTGLMASGLSAATIGGSVYDPSGAAVPGARLLLYNPDTSVKLESASEPDGKYQFDHLPGGQYVLRVERPGFAALFKTFRVKSESRVDQNLTLQVGSIEEQISVVAKGKAAQVPAAAGPQRVRVGGDVQPPRLLHEQRPEYPEAAKAAGIHGNVVLRAVVLMDGTPGGIRAVSSPSEELSKAAIEAVRQWRYSPALLNGKPVEVVIDITVRYALE